MKNRQFVIGDVHGELAVLKNLLAALDLQPQDELIFLGDIVDKGPQTAQTIDFLIDLQKKHKCIFIRGNHEEMMLAALVKGGRAADIWVRYGGQATLDAYGAASPKALKRKIPQAHMNFLSATLEAHLTKTHVFVHAAWDTRKKLARQTPKTLRYTFMNAVRPDKRFNKTIVCGHSSIVGGKPARHGNIICIDTIEYGWLTAYNLTQNHFTQISRKGETRVIEKPEHFTQERHVPARFRR